MQGRDRKGTSKRGTALVFVFLAVLVAAAAGVGTFLAGASEFTAPISSSGLSHARTVLEEGRIEEARALFSAELKRNPKDIEALRGLALCARDEGDDETALQYFQKLTALAPKDLAAWRQKALAASRLGRDLEAMAAAQTTLSLAPKGDRAMSDLMTRILTSDMDRLANPKVPGVDPPGRSSKPSTFDPLGDVPRPEPPDPTRGLPKPGRGD